MLEISTVFLSFARLDLPEIAPFIPFLEDHDFAVWTPDAIQAGQDWHAASQEALTEAADHGFVLAFLSAASLSSLWVKAEIAAFLAISKSGGRLILIDLEPVDHLVPMELQPFQRLRLHVHDDATKRRMRLQALGLT